MSKKDAYKVVTDRIIEALERGIVPWHKPWKSISGDGPMSLSTGKPYRGVNVWILGVTAAMQGYTSPYWATFKQAKEAAVSAARAEGRVIEERKSKRGGTYYVEIIDGAESLFRGGVRKGEQGTEIVLWKPVRKRVEDENGEEQNGSYLLLRYYTVFNLDQCDGVTAPERPADELAEHDPIADADALVTRYLAHDGPTLAHGGNRAYYAPAVDRVQMPLVGQFDTAEHYYGTLFHELAHSTGHSERLARPSLVEPTPFGTPDYSREELVAEMAAAFLCGIADIEPNVPQHTAYLQSWLKALDDDRKLIVWAAAQAQKAADLIVGTTKEEDSSESSLGQSPNHRRNHEPPPDRRSRRQLVGRIRQRRSLAGRDHLCLFLRHARASDARRRTAGRDHAASVARLRQQLQRPEVGPQGGARLARFLGQSSNEGGSMTKQRALIVGPGGRTRHVYLQQEIGDGGFWATSAKDNSNTGWSLLGDGKVRRERYHAQSNARLETYLVPGTTWRRLEAS